VGKVPDVVDSITLNYTMLERSDLPKQAFKPGEPLLLGIGTGTFVGYITSAKKNTVEVELKHPACIAPNEKISILRNFGQRWRLSGYAQIS